MNRETSQGSVAALIPITGVVFIAFLIIGMAMPVLPLHVHQGLGLGTFIVGLIAASTGHAQSSLGGNSMLPTEQLRTVAPALDRYTQERLLGEVWKRPGLS